MENEEICEHLERITLVKKAQALVCDECIKTGRSWVHLRTCQTCGATHCCDSSPGKHATQHFRDTGHPVIASAEPGEHWLWCYPDKQIREY